MTFLNIKSAAWAYSLITLGTEMLSSFFSFYCVKLFLELYKISELAFYQSQVILMICNVLNDLSGSFRMNSQYDCCLSYHCSLFGALLHSVVFLLPWFPWKHYQEGDWLNGLHLAVSLCAFDSTLAWVQQAQCRLFAETFPRHESRLQLMKINQVASLLGSTSILFCGLISHNMEILPNFQVVAVVIAFLASTSLYSGMFHMSHFECKRSPQETFLSESEQELAWTSTILPMRQLLSQKNFHLFLIMNFFQVFHLTFFSNFMMIFADNLIPIEVLSSSARSIMYGAGFICPQCLVLLGQSWLKKYGYYKIILISFYLEGAAAIVMLLLGQEYYYCLAVYLTVIMVIIQASFCLFNLPLADMVDADLLKFNGQSPLSLMVFGISALFTRPAQSLAPMLILSKLNQYGYGEPNNRMLLDLQDTMFNLVCVVPLGIATVQTLTWSSFSVRNRADYSGTI
ncbi:transmembrane protein 180 isoform X1 [Mesocricetus auratus]|uniref:Transmembrane protein 180 n=1 Tax=Mesocricetus auratus TaxID=10036 RepID=A0A1U7Q595_MESAU|nr:transmembrane protein 180 isoform X1 [Mesocricetus auratus]XP_040611169.1 transmembrane protein 180 isoform X1 [Mesocricetus auratus]XP_040611173.1 transmembrane protein 180 isoform X1 [Mesocricetus auratus]XP_040611197.1 transmembrane protein 180 isoform X1 [Mesocricetus auratus]